MRTLEEEVRSFIVDNFLLAEDGATLRTNDVSLTRSGVIDSVGVVELMHFIETRYGIEIADEEAVPENIDTIDNIVRYIRGKRARPDTAAGPEHADARA